MSSVIRFILNDQVCKKSILKLLILALLSRFVLTRGGAFGARPVSWVQQAHPTSAKHDSEGWGRLRIGFHSAHQCGKNQAYWVSTDLELTLIKEFDYFQVTFDHIWSEQLLLGSWGSSENWLELIINQTNSAFVRS